MLDHAHEVTFSGGKLQSERRDRDLQAMLTSCWRRQGVSLRELQMRRCFGQPAEYQILRGVHQGKFRVVGARSRRESLQQRLNRSGIAVKGQAKRVIGEQAGCI